MYSYSHYLNHKFLEQESLRMCRKCERFMGEVAVLADNWQITRVTIGSGR